MSWELDGTITKIKTYDIAGINEVLGCPPKYSWRNADSSYRTNEYAFVYIHVFLYTLSTLNTYKISINFNILIIYYRFKKIYTLTQSQHRRLPFLSWNSIYVCVQFSNHSFSLKRNITVINVKPFEPLFAITVQQCHRNIAR